MPRTTPRRLLLARRLAPILFTPLAACAPADSGEDAADPPLPATAKSPLAVHEEGLLDPGAVGKKERFGHAVAIWGDTALVGADRSPTGLHQGAAYVFVKDTVWSKGIKLEADPPAPALYFGVGVALRGDTALVGAPGGGLAGDTPGTAHVFRRDGESWPLESVLIPTGSQPDDRFGRAVALAGDVAFVGGAASNGTTGAVYAFSRTGAEWTQVQEIAPDGVEASASFGAAIAFSGDTLVIGAPLDWNGQEQSGAVHVFVLSGNTFVPKARLTPPPGWDEHFGGSVAISGDTIAVGARAAPGATGGVYLSERIGDTWSAPARLAISDVHVHDFVGSSVAVDGDFLAVGAPGRDTVGEDTGVVYVFERKYGSWEMAVDFALSQATEDDNLGFSVALQGGKLIAGAPRADTWAMESGAAQVYRLLLDDGQPCTDPDGCHSGVCVEGVCCDAPCAGEGLSCPGGRCTFTPEGETGGVGGEGGAGGGGDGQGGGGASTTTGPDPSASAPVEARSFYSCRISPGETGSTALAATTLLAGLVLRRRRRQGPS